ncbi:MAG: hypothetical protein HW410_1028 [Nitrosarchaeum sp.]|nr:hypothetical protein [Nitrosarchaeum sp.]
MTNDSNPLMNNRLTIEEYVQTKPDSVKKLNDTSLRILNAFTKLTHGKIFRHINISKSLSLEN